MASYLSVTDLVTRAKNGEQQAWDALVERYAPLIWSICRQYRLEAADAVQAAEKECPPSGRALLPVCWASSLQEFEVRDRPE